MITKIRLQNFKSFRDSIIEFSPELNIIVGDNDSGKSTVLEAIALASTGRYRGQFLASSLSSHLINKEVVEEYIAGIRDGRKVPLPEMCVEIFFESGPETQDLRGAHNSLREDSAGLKIEASFDPAFGAEYQELLNDYQNIRSLPIEYYRVRWTTFADGFATASNAKLTVSLIDASRIHLANGTDFYLQKIIADSLDATQRIHLARGYRDQMLDFGDDPYIASINDYLDSRKEDISDKSLALGIDASSANGWQAALAPFLDGLPVHYSGNGEQNMLKILLALARRVSNTDVVLIEEPENHLSFSSLNHLIKKIKAKSDNKQIVMTTHSSYVINKLGLNQLLLLSDHEASRLSQLSPDTQNYFMKLPGFDTLRIVLARKIILVEGPSDELIVQRAYLDLTGRRPIEDRVDVISVQGLAFKRFLDIAILLRRETVVITDNDGDLDKLKRKYHDYIDAYPYISICFSEDTSLSTLEPQIVGANDPEAIAAILKRPYTSKQGLIDFMVNNKSESALRIHDSAVSIQMPEYIRQAIHA
jgi:putative ATP-dependent endonuclease of the OLD family